MSEGYRGLTTIAVEFGVATKYIPLKTTPFLLTNDLYDHDLDMYHDLLKPQEILAMEGDLICVFWADNPRGLIMSWEKADRLWHLYPYPRDNLLRKFEDRVLFNTE